MGDRKKKRGLFRAGITIALIAITLNILYVIALLYPKAYHNEHSYRGYTYYSSKMIIDFDESEATYTFDSILSNEPEYKWLLDEFYKDGYRIFFDDKFMYALCSAHLFDSKNYSACVTFDNVTEVPKNGMFLNYDNELTTDLTFLHELSHYADYKMGYPSKSDEFKKIFMDEYENSTLGGIDYYNNTKEYFAEEAALFMIYKSRSYANTLLAATNDDAPETFEYIGNLLETMKNTTAQ